jgi:hypothetical protein
MEPVPAAMDLDLDAVRRHRAELRESIHALEQALAAPTPGRSRAWAERVHVALVELSSDLRQHVELTEGTDGLYSSVLASAPRLSNTVARLTREHADIQQLVDDLLVRANPLVTSEGVDRIRDLGTVLLGRLVRHRQRGADLLYEAYESDIGGET